MVGYLLELFWDGAVVEATMLMRQPSTAGTAPNLGVVFGGVLIKRHSQ
jgi:hypothetical protein